MKSVLALPLHQSAFFYCNILFPSRSVSFLYVCAHFEVILETVWGAGGRGGRVLHFHTISGAASCVAQENKP